MALAAYVIGYNVCARDDEMLSEAADRYMMRHPWMTRVVALLIAMHVTNAVPDKFDPIHWLFWGKRYSRARRNPVV